MLSVKGLANQIIEIDRQGGDPDVLKAFISYLDSRDALSLLPYVVHHLERHVEREKESKKLVVKVPYEISDKTLSSIRSYMEASKDSQTEVLEDKELIGGFVAEYKFKRHDTSLRNKLRKLKATLV